MKIRWNGHSCFTVETNQGTVVLDPYGPGSVPGLTLGEQTGDLVLCSHDHADHNYAQGVKLSGRDCTVQVDTIPCFHDKVQGAKRGPNTIHVITAEGMRLAHLGDLGHELAPEQLAALGQLDVLLIPVGGFFTIGPEQAAGIVKQLRPRVVAPMHYRGENFGYEVLAGVEDFLARVEMDAVHPDGNVLEVTVDTPAHIAVLRCPAEMN